MTTFLITLITLIMTLASPQPLPDPAHVAGICKGEASFAIEECACSVQNRVGAGWRPDLVMSAYYAPWIPPTEHEIELVATVLAGKTDCNPDFYYMLEPASVIHLGMSHLEPAGVIKSPDGNRRVSFYPREAWRERQP